MPDNLHTNRRGLSFPPNMSPAVAQQNHGTCTVIPDYKFSAVWQSTQSRGDLRERGLKPTFVLKRCRTCSGFPPDNRLFPRVVCDADATLQSASASLWHCHTNTHQFKFKHIVQAWLLLSTYIYKYIYIFQIKKVLSTQVCKKSRPLDFWAYKYRKWRKSMIKVCWLKQ